MKSKIILGLAAVGIFSLGAFTGCQNKKNDSSENAFSFMLSLENGSKRLRAGASSKIIVIADGNTTGKTYSYRSDNTAVLTVSNDGIVTGVADGSATINAVENSTKTTASLRIVVSSAIEASGGYNYASLAGEEALNTRETILGKLEKYAMDNHLTGITLFENGGYIKYSSRVSLPASEYITGFGFGLLSEGSVTGPMEKEEVEAHKMYLHSASSSDPLTINEKNNNGSQVSDLAGYITSSYWGTKLNSTKDKYEWYPLLAKDVVTIDGQQIPNTRPFPVYNDNIVKPNENPNPLGLYDTWRIYLKTGEDGIKYRTSNSEQSAYDHKNVELADYEFAYRFLLTGSHGQLRGTEMAGDTSYGIKGAQAYNTRTKTLGDAASLELWNSMKADGSLGIKTDEDEGGKYIQLSILNPIDRFTAMYTLSSSLVSPLPEQFIKDIALTNDTDKKLSSGAKRYGNFNATPSNPGDITKYTLCVGPYFLEGWNKNQTIIFAKNHDWDTVEQDRYNIEGVKIIVIKGATSDPDAIYKVFNDGQLDSCGIPTKHIAEEMGKPGVKQTKGDSTFKLNVNSCSQETWNELFGPQGTINKNSNWTVKPWMSNDNFLNGLFYSIDRKTFANNRGVQPSINYFSDAYLSDPENGKSYNSSEAHKEAIKEYQTTDKDGNDTYGYDYDRAVLAFKSAVRELSNAGKIEKGTKANPAVIQIHIRWMYQTDIKEYGDEIKGYFEKAFNNEAVSNGTVKLEVKQDAVTDWQEVYNEYLMKGQFDLGFGAISGNTYNPLNFLEVLRSDNSSGFTLNWGTDTSRVTESNPVEYDGKLWSFDALWEVADHGGVVDNGRSVKSVKECYMETAKSLGGEDTNNLYEGFTVDIPLTFVNVPKVEFDVSKVQIYIFGSGNENVSYVYDKDNNVIHVTVNADRATELEQKIITTNKLDKDPVTEPHPFVLKRYGYYWTFEVYYTISIDGGTPSESYVTVAKNRDSQEKNSIRFLGGE